MRRRVLVFRDGLVVIVGSQATACRWDDIESVTEDVKHVFINGSYNHSEERFTLRRYDGESVIVKGPLRDMAVLGETIQQEVTSRRFPVLQQALARGETVAFGDFTLNPTGLGYRQEELPWGEVGQLKVENGFVKISKAGVNNNWVLVEVARIPNVRAFLGLIAPRISKTNDI